MIRRKILNREAAQKARDRKRDLVASMEHDLANLQAENNYLKASNRFLRKRFAEQEQKFNLLEKKLKEILRHVKAAESNQIEPPESAALLPRLKGYNVGVPTEIPEEQCLKEDCPPFLFDGEVVELSTNGTPVETETFAASESVGDLTPAPPSLYEQIFDSLQSDEVDPPSALSPCSNSTDEFNELMEFLYCDNFDADTERLGDGF
ncbi:unnamed protein product [Calicophoron daubneyi]|uniref:BZIP domain-containing protein n=1 Tax=Calicophoron daubneyi TaxID=300641 RepID=A0AAV2TSA9_CALDB